MSVLERDPPSIEDPTRKANAALEDAKEQSQEEFGDEEPENDEGQDWLTVAREAFQFSTTYIDTNHRKRWEDGIRAFNNMHPQDSKYTTQSFERRSHIYRPKARAIMRKHEAAAAAAYFSNLDYVDIQAERMSDPYERASAEINKALVQYRLKKSIPWFQIVMGALQDAQKVGSCVARVYWEYEQERGRVVQDRPRIELIPIENFRIDPACDWSDPVNTSPYVIQLIPMYLCDVRAKQSRRDPKTGRPEWKATSDSMLRAATSQMPDSTRIIREKNREDPTDTENRPISDYTMVWVQRHIHRRDGRDWEFYTLSDIALLSDPQPLIKSTWHGKRDYVMGCVVLETHTSLPSSVPELARNLIDEINEVTNQRLDNVKLVLNKRWLVKRNKNVDAASLVRNVPGSVTMADNLDDVLPVEYHDVTASSFQEQDRLNVEMDELLGNFSATSAMQNRANPDTVGGLHMINQPANMMTEYLLQTFTYSFVEPVLRMLVMLEQKYETDQTVLALAADTAQVWQRYGVSAVTDDLLNRELTVRVNVGMGATDPATKLQKFIMALNSWAALVKAGVPGLNLQEVGKEIFSHAGYQDGRRFFTIDNPQVAQLQQQLQQAMMMIQQLGKQVQDRTQDNQTKVEVAKINKEAKESVEGMKQNQALPVHEHALKAYEVALGHERKFNEFQRETELKMRKFAAETLMKVQAQHAKQALDVEAMQRKHALALQEQGLKHERESKPKEQAESKSQPVIIENHIHKPRDKTITIERRKDGSMVGHVKHAQPKDE